MSVPTSSETHTHDASHDAEHVAKHIKLYLTVGALLFVFTIITVGLSYVHFGSHSMNIIVGMIVATFKACCVAAVFMHLWGGEKLIWRVLYFTVFFAIGLFALTYFGWVDPIPGTEHWQK